MSTTYSGITGRSRRSRQSHKMVIIGASVIMAAAFILAGAVVYIAWHFVAKFW